MPSEKVEVLRQRLSATAEAGLARPDFMPILIVDAHLILQKLNGQTYQSILRRIEA